MGYTFLSRNKNKSSSTQFMSGALMLAFFGLPLSLWKTSWCWEHWEGTKCEPLTHILTWFPGSTQLFWKKSPHLVYYKELHHLRVSYTNLLYLIQGFRQFLIWATENSELEKSMHLNIKIMPIRNNFITLYCIKLGKIKIPGYWRIQDKITRRQHTVMVVKFRVDFLNQYNDL